MTFASATQLHVYLLWDQCPFSCLNSVLNVKALVGTFNQVKALVGALSVIVTTDGLFAALIVSVLLFKLGSLVTNIQIGVKKPSPGL